MKVFHFHHIGKRKTQEDDLFIDPNGKLFIICDGVGGQAHGEKASALVIETIANKFSNWSGAVTIDIVKEFLVSMNQEFMQYLIEHEIQEGMASTLVLLYLEGDYGIVSHVGDSRLYHIKGENDWWVTKDHSMVMELHEAGIIPSEEAMIEHPLRNRITKAVTISRDMKPLDPEINEIENIEAGDLFFLCSDGVSASLTNKELITKLTEVHIEKAWGVLDFKCKEFANDNATAILIQL